jgi:[calcium/calmodulin-dependent protein kinase] kinase
MCFVGYFSVSVHQNHIIHRDIKPDNILLSVDRRTVKLGDFGVSHLFSGDDDSIRITGGTPCFHAPEMCRGTKEYKYNIGVPPAAMYYTYNVLVVMLLHGLPVCMHIDEYVSGAYCDIWALGVTMYIFMYGKVPWTPRCGRMALMKVKLFPVVFH